MTRKIQDRIKNSFILMVLIFSQILPFGTLYASLPQTENVPTGFDSASEITLEEQEQKVNAKVWEAESHLDSTDMNRETLSPATPEESDPMGLSKTENQEKDQQQAGIQADVDGLKAEIERLMGEIQGNINQLSDEGTRAAAQADLDGMQRALEEALTKPLAEQPDALTKVLDGLRALNQTIKDQLQEQAGIQADVDGLKAETGNN